QAHRRYRVKEKLSTHKRAQNWRPKHLDAHGHDDVAIAVLVIRQGAQLTGGLLIFQLHADRSVRSGGEKIQQILAVEADRNGLATIFFVDILGGFTVLGTRGRKFYALLGDGEFQSVRALVGELRDAAYRVVEFVALQDNFFVVVPRQDGFVVGKLTGEDARNQQARFNLKE